MDSDNLPPLYGKWNGIAPRVGPDYFARPRGANPLPHATIRFTAVPIPVITQKTGATTTVESFKTAVTI